MKRTFLFFTVITFSLSACHRADKELNETISNADSAAINYFIGNGAVDTVTTVKIIRDKDTLAQLTDFITESVSKIKPNCGYDGSIHFYKNDSVVKDINFRMNDDECRQFTFIENGKQKATTLSQKAADLLHLLGKITNK